MFMIVSRLIYSFRHSADIFVMDYSSPYRGLRDMTNLPQVSEKPDHFTSMSTISGVSNDPFGDLVAYPTFHPSRACYCKLLLTAEEATEVLQATMLPDKCDLEAISGSKVDSLPASVSYATLTGAPVPPDDIVIVLSGPMPCIHSAVSFLSEKVGSLRDDEFVSALRRRIVSLRIVVPNSVVGVLMGRGGKDIRNLAVSSGVRIQISQRVAGALERVVHVTGTAQQAVLAGITIIETIQSDPHTQEHAEGGRDVVSAENSARKRRARETGMVRSDRNSPETVSATTADDEAALAKCLQDLLSQLQEHPELLMTAASTLAGLTK